MERCYGFGVAMTELATQPGAELAAHELSEFAEERALEGPVNLEDTSCSDGPQPRDLVEETREELADARNYLVWHIQANGLDLRALAALGYVIEAFQALESVGPWEEEQAPKERIHVGIDFSADLASTVVASEDAAGVMHLVASDVVERIKPYTQAAEDAWQDLGESPTPACAACPCNDDQDGCCLEAQPVCAEDDPDLPLSLCCLIDTDPEAAALCMEDRRIEQFDKQVAAQALEDDEAFKVEAFADAGARAVEAQEERDIESGQLAGQDPTVNPHIDGDPENAPRVGTRVRTHLTSSPREPGGPFHGCEGRILRIDENRELWGSPTDMNVLVDLDPDRDGPIASQCWFRPSELTVIA